MKAPFSFFSAIASKASVVPMPVLNKDFWSFTLSTALLVTAGERARSSGSTLGKMCPPQCWPNPPAPLARLGAEILSWQQALFHVRALSADTLLGRAFGFGQLDFLNSYYSVFAQKLPCWLVPCLAEAWQLGCGHWHWSGWLLLETLSSQCLLDRKPLSNPGQEMGNLIHFLKLVIFQEKSKSLWQRRGLCGTKGM